MTCPLFTIIIPTYNVGKTISACVDSIINQSFQDFEVLIVDGVSSDDTVPIVKRYVHDNAKIKLVSETDMGIYDAMNKGIRKASGGWLYFLGADDIIHDQTVLEKIAEEIRSDDTLEVVYGNVWSERFNGVYDGKYDQKKILSQNICHQAIFFSKVVFEKTGDFDLKYRAQSDWDHNLKWFLRDDITRKYINIVMAVYADGGFSSIQGDDLFHYNKRFNYVYYGRDSLSRFRKYIVLQIDILKALKRWDLKKARRLTKYLLNDL